MTWSTSSCHENHLIIKICALGLLGHTYYFYSQMIGIMRKRFKEISDKQRLRIKSRWLDPLKKEELEKLGIFDKKNVLIAK